MLRTCATGPHRATVGAMTGVGLDRPVRIAHLATRLIIAGMGNVVASLVREASEERCHQSIWCLEEADTLGQILRGEGHSVVELGRRHRRDFGLFVRIARSIRQNKIDVLHCHDELAWFYGVIGGLLGGVPAILVTMHGRRQTFSSRHLWEQRLLARLSSRVVCVSKYLGQQILSELGTSPNKVVTIRNGIDLSLPQSSLHARSKIRLELGLQDSAFVVGAVGRLDAVKNFDLLFETIGDARSVVPSLRLVLVGEGPCRDHLLQKRSQLGLEDCVVMTGLRRDIPDLLASFDLYVCSSDYEGISLSILEAMAARTAVVATAVGGNVELVSHDHTGVLVKPKHVREMVAAIVDLSRDSQRRIQLGRQARSFVEQHFSLPQMIEEYDRLYHAVLTDQ